MSKYMDRKYIYMRDHQRCVFCGKDLKLGNMSVDHYYPRSRNGSYDVFNLVASCKRCNRWKGNAIPSDWQDVLLKLFKQALEDKRMTSSIPKMKIKTLQEWAVHAETIEFHPDYAVIESDTKLFYIHQNRIFRISDKTKSSQV